MLKNIQLSNFNVKFANIRGGFTIVELLIVIVVIAILTAIVTVSYNGISARAIETTIKSDLLNVANLIEMDKSLTDSYPISASAANTGQGIKTSGDNALSYELKPYGYCATISNPKVTLPFRIRSDKGQIEPGDCSAEVTTLAGSTSYGYTDAMGPAAQFGWVIGIAIDSSGNLYVADDGNNNIRKITQSGTVTTFAGSGVSGYADGAAATAQFNTPQGVATDGSGNVYIADGNNHRIRKITPSGNVTTLAGSGWGYDDGTGAAAKFSSPKGIAIDSSGNVYVADNGSHRIRKITPNGTVTTFAGSGVSGYADGAAATAQFSYPRGIAVDKSDNVYVLDNETLSLIRKITPSGNVSTVAGSESGYADGASAVAQFNQPYALAVDNSGNIYVADPINYRIRKVSPTGIVSTVAGSDTEGFADGSGTAAEFTYPMGITIDSNGIIYVADSHRIRKITP